MKKAINLTLILTIIFFIACNNQKKTVNENPFIGAWEETYFRSVSPDTAYERTQFEPPRIKLFTDKHFALGYQAGENKIAGGGGKYEYDADSYTSTILYHSNSGMVGITRKFKSVLNGDLWTITYRNDSTNVEITEIWKRIPE